MRNIAVEAINIKRQSIGYLKELKYLSRKNRNNPTLAEQKIWKELLQNKMTGYLFLRQKPIFRFIIDFYCPELHLAIEVDGDCHDHRKWYDEARDKYLKAVGIKTIRFTNNEVLNNIAIVKELLL